MARLRLFPILLLLPLGACTPTEDEPQDAGTSAESDTDTDSSEDDFRGDGPDMGGESTCIPPTVACDAESCIIVAGCPNGCDLRARCGGGGIEGDPACMAEIECGPGQCELHIPCPGDCLVGFMCWPP